MLADGALVSLFEAGKHQELRDALGSPEEKAAALHLAVEQKRADLVAFLLGHGAACDALNVMNRTPLHVAALLGDEGIVRELLTHGADCNRADSAMVTKGPLGSQSKKTAIHHAAMQGYRHIVQLLLAHGADPSLLDENGNTPQQLATKYGHFETAQILPGDFRKAAGQKWDQTRAPRQEGVGPQGPQGGPQGPGGPMAMPMPQWSPGGPEGMAGMPPPGYPVEYIPYMDPEGAMYAQYEAYPVPDGIGIPDPSMELYMPMTMPPGAFIDYHRRAVPMPPPGMARPELVKQGNQARYKTELCRAFQDKGVCKYGEKCQFAHGHNELRSLPRHPKYKTEMCRTFHSTGICPYGPRCHFIHNSEQEASMRPYPHDAREHMAMQGPPMAMPMREMMLPFPPMPMYDPYMRPPEDMEMAYAHAHAHAHQFMPVHFIEPVEDVRGPVYPPHPHPHAAPRQATPPMDHAVPSVAPSVGPSTTPSPPASVSTMSPPSGNVSTRSPPVGIAEAAEALAGIRIASPPADGDDTSPQAQSPRRLPVFSAFKK
eukprot:m.233287 g.233287  ORF g.233287 m.233287 type:complete len:542 (+) comp12489_c0_seq1:51-1676(+)